MKIFVLIFTGLLMININSSINDSEIKIERISTKSGYDGINANFNVSSSLSDFLVVLNDVDNYKNWAYNCLDSGILDYTNPNNFSYYSIIDFPWPMSNRIAGASCYQYIDENGVYYSNSKGISDKIDKLNLVPLPYFESEWQITPISDTEVHVQYKIIAEPVLNIPSSIYNLAVEIAPRKTIEALISHVETNKNLKG